MVILRTQAQFHRTLALQFGQHERSAGVRARITVRKGVRRSEQRPGQLRHGFRAHAGQSGFLETTAHGWRADGTECNHQCSIAISNALQRIGPNLLLLVAWHGSSTEKSTSTITTGSPLCRSRTASTEFSRFTATTMPGS